VDMVVMKLQAPGCGPTIVPSFRSVKSILP
jgi:hypothetical protein